MLLTIITVVYNGSSTIRQTLQSVAEQSYPHIEHIIIDGASTDKTLSIVQQFPYVKKILSEPDKGIYDAMNKGIALASGKVIGILNADDVLAHHEVIEKVAEQFKHDKSLDLLYGNIAYFQGNNTEKIVRYWQTKPFYDTFFEDGEVPPHPALYVRKKVYDSVGTYRDTFRISGDYDFMFRALKMYEFNSYFLNETLVNMRIGGVSTSGLKSYWISTKELIKVWHINGYKYPIQLLWIRPIKKLLQLINRK